MTQEALKLALDALENHTAIKHPQQIYYRDKAITAIKEALAQSQRTWVGLDDDELTEAWHWGGCDPHIEGAHFKALYQYFEAKLKDKNDVAQKTD